MFYHGYCLYFSQNEWKSDHFNFLTWKEYVQLFYFLLFKIIFYLQNFINQSFPNKSEEHFYNNKRRNVSKNKIIEILKITVPQIITHG